MTIFFVSVTDLYDKKEVIVFVVDVCKFKMSDKQYGTFVIICLKWCSSLMHYYIDIRVH